MTTIATLPTAPTQFRKLSPLLKWAGGKEQELKHIIPSLPEFFEDYYEPFVGGGAVFTSIDAQRYYINDRSEELISLYQCLAGAGRPEFFDAAEEMLHQWDQLKGVVQANEEFLLRTYRRFSVDAMTEETLLKMMHEFIADNSHQFIDMFVGALNVNASNFMRELQVNVVRKIKRMKHIEQLKSTLPSRDVLDNIETSLKSAFYMHVRHIYNNVDHYGIQLALRSAIFLFVRNYAYGGMFRYNAAGQFNVPYGGIAYNNKNFRKKLDYLKSDELRDLLNRSTIQNLDFESFLRTNAPTPDDFVFFDPPYDSEFSTYTKNKFVRSDQVRLANYLVNDCRGKWMLVIKTTDFIRNLYLGHGLNIIPFEKRYLVSFMNRNDKSAEHLLITNY